MAAHIEDMEAILDEELSSDEIRAFEKKYNAQLERGQPSCLASFEYAHCLIRSREQREVKLGVKLFESEQSSAQVQPLAAGLIKRDEQDVTHRECIFYVAMGYARLKEYDAALQWVGILADNEPMNMQVKSLKAAIEKRRTKGIAFGFACHPQLQTR